MFFESGHKNCGYGYLGLALCTVMCALWLACGALTSAGAPFVPCTHVSDNANDMARPVAQRRCTVELDYDLGCSECAKACYNQMVLLV